MDETFSTTLQDLAKIYFTASLWKPN